MLHLEIYLPKLEHKSNWRKTRPRESRLTHIHSHSSYRAGSGDRSSILLQHFMPYSLETTSLIESKARASSLWLEFQACSTEKSAMPCTAIPVKTSWLAEEVICPRTEAATVVVLNGHVVKLPSKYLWLSPQISAALNSDQRSFSFQWAVINWDS